MQQGKSPDEIHHSSLQWLTFLLKVSHEKSHPAHATNDPMAVVSTLLRGRKKDDPKALAAFKNW